MSCHLCNACSTDSHYRLRKSNQMVGESLIWQAGRSTDHGLAFRQCALASFTVCSNSVSSLAMEKAHWGHCTVSLVCHAMILCSSDDLQETFLSSSLPTEKPRNGGERISSTLTFSSSYCGNQDHLFHSHSTLWKTPMKASVCSALSPQSWESPATHKALLSKHFQQLLSGLRWKPDCPKAAARTCRATRVGKTAAIVPMI